MTLLVLASGNADPTTPVYPAQRSVRTRRSASARFTRTFGTPTSSTIYTWSAWVKRGSLGLLQNLFGAGTNYSFGFTATDALVVTLNGTAAATTTALWRDPCAWYHLMYVQNGASQTIYVNGISRATGTTANSLFNTAVDHLTCASNTTTPANFFDGYLALNYFIDGQALLPTAFGSYNAGSGVWQPIKYTGTFGNNGYFLQFLDYSGSTSTTLGKDTSGNSNNWTPSNINTISPTAASYDSYPDVPTVTSATTANFCVFNALDKDTGNTVSDGGLKVVTSTTGQGFQRGSLFVNTGKWYWEVLITSNSGNSSIGVAGINTVANTTNYVGATADSYGYIASNGNKYNNGTNAAYGSTYTTNDVIGVALNMNAGTLEFFKNGVYQGIAYSGLSGFIAPAVSDVSNSLSSTFEINFGQRTFIHGLPSGYSILNTYVLNATVPNASKAFATTAYSGNNSTQTIANTQNGSSFQPDIVWGKSRTSAVNNVVYDSVRGVTKQIVTNSSAAQTTQATGLTAFTSSGFTSGALAELNSNLSTYYAYQWKVGGGVTTWNFDGTLNRSCTVATGATTTITLNTNGFSAGQAIRFTGTLPTGLSAGTTYYAGGVATNTFNVYDTEVNAIAGGATGKIVTSGSGSGMACYHASKISVNRQTGISIISYVGVGANTTVGHGLGSVVDFAIIKSTTAVTSWPVYHKGIGNTKYVSLNGTGAATVDSTYWNNTTPTSSVISLGTNANLNTNGATFIMFAFATVPGFSYYEAYTGNGSTDGVFVYSGFKPRFSISKQADVGRSWITLNTSGQTYNVEGPYLFADVANAEGVSTTLADFVSNGTKFRAGNANNNAANGVYIYMAWAEYPFKYGVGA